MMQFEPGQVYDVAHLRPFDMELAKAGHPLAMDNGNAVRLFRMRSESSYIWDWWDSRFNTWAHLSDSETCLPDWLRLAPLAVKDGKPLHVGDEIYLHVVDDFWQRETINSIRYAAFLTTNRRWRWPKDCPVRAEQN